VIAPTNPFDPIAIVRALDVEGVRFVVVGALGRVIHGSGEVTDGLDIVPSAKTDNLRRLGVALDKLNARRIDRKPLAVESDLADQPVLALRTAAGDLKIVLEPVGTQGYDDLRRGATREPLGRGVRPAIASLGDHARMLAALNREQDQEALRTVRRLIELARTRTRGRGLSIER
jgi:hypothetical protein